MTTLFAEIVLWSKPLQFQANFRYFPDQNFPSLADTVEVIDLLPESLTEPPTLSAIALGCNLGDCCATLEQSLQLLAATPGITLLARSRWYRTTPVGPPQPDYLNGCALLRVSLTPMQLLERLLEVERVFGRLRQERNGPRTLDLDLLLFGDRILQTPNLEIPHPRMNDRAFVLVPLAEIAPDWIEPRSGQTIAQLCQRACQPIAQIGVWPAETVT